MIQWPQEASLRIFEKGAIIDRAMGSIFLNVPGCVGTPPQDAKPIPYPWTSSLGFHPAWAPAEQVSDHSTAEIPLHPSGTIFIQCGWVPRNCSQERLPFNELGSLDSGAIQPQPNDLELGLDFVPPTPNLSADAILRRSVFNVCFSVSLYAYSSSMQNCLKMPRVASIQSSKVVKIGKCSQGTLLQQNLLQNIGLDPNDPRNDALLELMKSRNAETSAFSIGKVYRIGPSISTQLQPETHAIGKRARFLQKRWLALCSLNTGWTAAVTIKFPSTPLSLRDIYSVGRFNESYQMLDGLLDKDTPGLDCLGPDQSTKLGLISGEVVVNHIGFISLSS